MVSATDNDTIEIAPAPRTIYELRSRSGEVETVEDIEAPLSADVLADIEAGLLRLVAIDSEGYARTVMGA
jgi:hypothetical protein